jgi:hypothetical protein
LNSIRSPAHPPGIEDNYTCIANFAKNCGAAFFKVALNGDPTVPLNSIQKHGRIGEESEQIAVGFSDKGHMI